MDVKTFEALHTEWTEYRDNAWEHEGTAKDFDIWMAEQLATLRADNARLRAALLNVADFVGLPEATIPPGSTPEEIAWLIIEALEWSE
jgi:hypothetical protein